MPVRLIEVGLYQSLAALGDATTEGAIDWSAAADAATASTPRGELDLDEATVATYRQATIEARDAVSAAVGRDVVLPETIEVIDRHHWIERSAASFDRMISGSLPQPELSVAMTVNTASAAVTLAMLARRVVGQYEPALFGGPDDTALYVVEPNAVAVADDLDVEATTFRRWILHHEVVHAAEFALAPWLRTYLEERFTQVLASLANGQLDREALDDITRAMTAVEGFAELLMDEAIDADVAHLRDRLEARRAGLGPFQQLVDWLLGISSKRRQYKRGRAFFATVAQAKGLEATLAVWDAPSALPTAAELDAPERWIERIDP